MSRFSPSDVALEGFRLTRERPVSVLVWAGFRLLVSVATLFAFTAIGGRAAIGKMAALQQGPQPIAPEAAQAALSQLLPSLLMFAAVNLVSYSIFYTATLRAILRPADKSFAYFRLSMDEVRQFLLALICFFLVLSYAFILTLVWTVAMTLAGGLGQMGILLEILVWIALAAGIIYPAVRLSLAPAMTFVDGKISLFRSAPLTQDRFWSLFGAYVLAFVLTVVVALLALVIFIFVIGAIGVAQGGGLSDLPAILGMLQSQNPTIQGLLNPLELANIAFNALLTTLGYVIMAAPAVAIFRDLSTTRPASTAPIAPGQPWG